MCDDIAPPETVWCNHKPNYIGSDRFCHWCRLDYRHPQRGMKVIKWMRLFAWYRYWAPIYFRLHYRSWYNQYDLVVISSWSSASIVLLSTGFHAIGFVMSIASFAFGFAGLFLADME